MIFSSGTRKATDAEVLILSIPLDGDNESEVARFEKIIDNNLDWDHLVRRTAHHHVAPFLYYNLKNINLFNRLPSRLAGTLSQINTKAVAKNLALLNAAGEMADHFNAQKITFLMLKGMALYLTVYKDAPGRHMSDVDILVKESQMEEARLLLSNLGYDISREGHPSVWHSLVISGALKEQSYIKKWVIGNVEIDMHWGINKGPDIAALDVCKFWSRRICIDTGDRCFFVLSPEDLLIHLCLNLCKNVVLGDLRLLLFCDVISTIRFYEDKIDWDYIADFSSSEGIEKQVYAVLARASALRLVNFPARINQKINPFVKEGFLSGEGLFRIGAGMEKKYYMGLISNISGMRNKARFILSIIFPAKSNVEAMCPSEDKHPLFDDYIYYYKMFFLKFLRLIRSFLTKG